MNLEWRIPILIIRGDVFPSLPASDLAGLQIYATPVLAEDAREGTKCWVGYHVHLDEMVASLRRVHREKVAAEVMYLAARRGIKDLITFFPARNVVVPWFN